MSNNKSTDHREDVDPVVENLRRAQEEDGRSYAQLARATGLPLDRLLAEVRDCSQVLLVSTICLLADALGVRPGDMFREESHDG